MSTKLAEIYGEAGVVLGIWYLWFSVLFPENDLLCIDCSSPFMLP